MPEIWFRAPILRPYVAKSVLDNGKHRFSRAIVSRMREQLHDLLKSDQPVALPQIERALASEDDLNDDQEAVLSALIWRRCTSGSIGLLGTVVYQDCASRIEDLPQHLETIGAKEAARAVAALREEIPLEDERIRQGLVDWIDTEADLAAHAQELGSELEEIDGIVWNFMRDASSDIPDLEITSRAQDVVSSLKSWLQLGRQGNG